jgi:acetyl esterase/lipase
VPGALPPDRITDRENAVPTLTPFLLPVGVDRPAPHPVVVVCPGGGYSHLAMDKEGDTPARWLNSLGISAVVLRYRLKDYGHPAPLRDVLQAVRTVRARAAEWGVDPRRTGAMGFSAGGHLASCAGTLYAAPEGRTGGAWDAISARPDFLVLVYPVITFEEPFVHRGSRASLFGPHPPPALLAELSTETRVTKDTPPTFLVHSSADPVVPVENSVMFYTALRRAGVPAEMHLYSTGPHGFGLLPGHGPISDWPRLCEAWLRAGGWTGP